MGALTAPTSVALSCRWRSRPQHQTRKSRTRNPQVRFALKNGHRQPDLLGPIRAMNGLIQHSKITSSAVASTVGGKVDPGRTFYLKPKKPALTTKKPAPRIASRRGAGGLKNS